MSDMLRGKVIIVTGAGGGIGTASCLTMARAGAKVVVSDISESAASATCELVRSEGGEASVVIADVASETSVQELVDKTVEIYGRLDGAFNNAGIEQCNAPLTDLTLEQWDRCLRINLTSVFLCVKYQVRALLKSGGGAIVNTSSGLGQISIPNAGEYIASKHGVLGVTRAAATEYGAVGIRVNAILPGVIRTPIVARLSDDPHLASFFESVKARQMNRLGEPEEIGQAAAWLLSDQASFVNGTAFAVDGGFMAR